MLFVSVAGSIFSRSEIDKEVIGMRPQCQDCGKFVPIGKGVTTEISLSKDSIHKGHREKAYLCEDHGDKIEQIKTYPWYAGHRIV